MYGQSIDLDYHDIDWFALEMNRDHSVVSEIAAKYNNNSYGLLGTHCAKWIYTQYVI